MYFTPDGGAAIVVAEAHKRLDFATAHDGVQYSIERPNAAASITRFFQSTALRDFYLRVRPRAWLKSISSRKRVAGYLKFCQGGCRRTCVFRRRQSFLCGRYEADGVFVVRWRQVYGDRTTSKPASATHGLYPAADRPGRSTMRRERLRALLCLARPKRVAGSTPRSWSDVARSAARIQTVRADAGFDVADLRKLVGHRRQTRHRPSYRPHKKLAAGEIRTSCGMPPLENLR